MLPIMQQRREQFHVSIRKHQTEEIFKHKRIQSMMSTENHRQDIFKMESFRQEIAHESEDQKSIILSDLIELIKQNLFDDPKILSFGLKLLEDFIHDNFCLFYVHKLLTLEDTGITKCIMIFRICTQTNQPQNIIVQMVRILKECFSAQDCYLDVFILQEEVIIQNLLLLLEEADDQPYECELVQALHQLFKNANEYQIQILMQQSFYQAFLEYLKYAKRQVIYKSQESIILVLQSITFILDVYSLQLFGYDYPLILQSYALHDDQTISTLAGTILEYFEKIDN